MGIIFLLVLSFVGFTMYCVCVVSSKCSREEERVAESIEKARVES